MLLALWSPKGGSGTSVLAAARALVLARGPAAGCRIADLGGDQPAIFGLAGEPELGLSDWLEAGAAAPVEALDRLLVEVAPGIALLPFGAAVARCVHVRRPRPGPRSRSRCATFPFPVVADCGAADDPATRALAEVADVVVVVDTRLLPRAAPRGARARARAFDRAPCSSTSRGARLSRREIADVLGMPVLARVPVRDTVSRAVDAGVLATRLPDVLARAAHDRGVTHGDRACPRSCRVTVGPRMRTQCRCLRPTTELKLRVHRRLLAEGADDTVARRRGAARSARAPAARRAALARRRSTPPARRRAHRRGDRPRPTRAAAGRSDGHRGDAQRARPCLRRARGAARAGARWRSMPPPSCGSSNESSRRSVSVSIAPPRWSTPVSPTVRGSMR